MSSPDTRQEAVTDLDEVVTASVRIRKGALMLIDLAAVAAQDHRSGFMAKASEDAARKVLSERGIPADALGVSCAVADKRLYGDAAVNLQCAAIVGADVRGGDLESALAFVAPIEAALGGAAIPLFQALHEAELADNAEQYADETFREKLRQGTATADDAREFIRKSAAARHKAEEAERAAQRWINHQEACG